MEALPEKWGWAGIGWGHTRRRLWYGWGFQPKVNGDGDQEMFTPVDREAGALKVSHIAFPQPLSGKLSADALALNTQSLDVTADKIFFRVRRVW